MRFRQFYLVFPILAQVARISWSNILKLLPITDINKRNYYINLCIERNLSKRELLKEIKSNSYERLINKPEKIDIVTSNKKFDLLDNMKNPIIIEVARHQTIKNEKDLEMIILSQLSFFFKQLGKGFCLVESEYKINGYRIDMLLFNIELNAYVVVELKLRELKKEDKGQIELYMSLIDDYLKKPLHNKTVGIIITKEQNKLIANFIRRENLIPLEYKINTF